MLPTLELLQQSTSLNRIDDTVREKLDRFLPYEETIQHVLGTEFTNRMEDAWDDLHGAEIDHAYESGFLAAFRLWMEISPRL